MKIKSEKYKKSMQDEIEMNFKFHELFHIK